MKMVFSAGRFNGPTIEHHRLIQRLIDEPGDKHYVCVFGPKDVCETSFKNPFTISEKMDQLRRLYPKHADIFIPGNSTHTCSPNQVLSYLWHLNRYHYVNIGLTIVAGSGTLGIKTRDEGGSIGAYQDIIERMNNTKFPGGDYRMQYDPVEYIANPRGSISSRIVREFAIRNVNNHVNVGKFRSMLHPNIGLTEAKTLMEIIQERGYNGLPGIYRKARKGN